MLTIRQLITRGEKGYIDYLTLAQERGEAPKPAVDESWR